MIFFWFEVIQKYLIFICSVLPQVNGITQKKMKMNGNWNTLAKTCKLQFYHFHNKSRGLHYIKFLHKSWKEERGRFINSWVFFTSIYFEIISRSSNNKKSEHCSALIQFSLRHRWTDNIIHRKNIQLALLNQIFICVRLLLVKERNSVTVRPSFFTFTTLI